VKDLSYVLSKDRNGHWVVTYYTVE